MVETLRSTEYLATDSAEVIFELLSVDPSSNEMKQSGRTLRLRLPSRNIRATPSPILLFFYFYQMLPMGWRRIMKILT